MIRALFTMAHDASTIDALQKRANRILNEFVQKSYSGPALKHLAQKRITAYPEGEDPSEDQKLLQILVGLRGNKKISDAQAEAFLCTPAHCIRLQMLQAVILLAALEHLERFGKPERPLRAMMAYRLLSEDQARRQKRLNAIKVINYLAIAWGSVDHFVSDIDQIFVELSGERLNYAQQRLLPIRRILKDLIAESLGNLRSYDSSRGKASTATNKIAVEHEQRTGSVISRGPISDTGSAGDFGSYPEATSKRDTYQLQGREVTEAEDFPAYTELSLQPILSDKTQEPSEHRSDNQTSGLFIATQVERSAPASLRRSHVLSAMHAQTVAGSIERREKRLVCLTNRLTKYETEILRNR